MSCGFVLLDRDGTLIVEKNYLSDPAEVVLLPGAVAGLRHFANLGMKALVITNQSGVGRGYFSMAQVDAIHRRINELLAEQQTRVERFYVCPHTPDSHCHCRKPEPGLIEQAARDFGFDSAASIMIGDKLCDMELGRRVGAKTILVRTGYGLEHESLARSSTDFLADDLHAAAQIAESFRGTHGEA